MKRNILFLTTALFLFLITSCTTEDPGPNCGTIKFSWKANGTYYEGSSNYHFLPSGGGFHTYGFSACTTGNAPSLSIRLKGPIVAGTYNLMDINDATTQFEGDGSYLDGTGSGYFGTDSTHLGTVAITTFATDSAITGTFNYSAKHSTSSSVLSITEGTFTTIPY
jgi:hypothetical protein